MRRARKGERNHVLNVAAFRLGQLATPGEAVVIAEYLLDAAASVGLPKREAQRTIESGLMAGARKPRGVPA